MKLNLAAIESGEILEDGSGYIIINIFLFLLLCPHHNHHHHDHHPRVGHDCGENQV